VDFKDRNKLLADAIFETRRAGDMIMGEQEGRQALGLSAFLAAEAKYTEIVASRYFLLTSFS
jgi:hypothetical protein